MLWYLFMLIFNAFAHNLKIQTLTSPPSVLLRVLQVRRGAEVAEPGAARDARHWRLE
jgi:hypothetical protein